MRKRPQTIRLSLAVAVVALLVSLAAVAGPPAQAATNCSPSSSWGSNRADLAAQVVSLINQYRAGKGLSQLAVSAPLTAASAWKSLHMAGYGYFAHDDPAPPASRSAYQRARDCDYSGSRWGENIAWGYASAQSVVNGWLASAGHKANIENPSFSSTGVGVAANGSGQLYWTQNFGNDASGGAPPAPPAPAPAPAPPAPAPAPPAPAPPASAPATPAPTTPAPTTPAPTPTPAPAPPTGAPVAAVSAGSAASAGATAPTPSTSSVSIGAKPARVTRQSNRARLTASVAFVQMKTGRPLATGSVRCRAEVSGKRLRVLTNAFKSQKARCAWRIPTWAKGKQLTGVVAVQVGEKAALRLFVRTVE